jgi:hypothetical protein
MYQIFKSKKFIIPALAITIAYVLLVTYLMNFQLTKDTLLGSYPIGYKWNIMTALLQGLGTSMTKFALVLLILTAVLTGINLTLVTLRLSALRSGGKLHIMVGGSSVIAIVTSGCAMCGLPILGLLGLSGSLIYLPFQGTELSVISVILLLITLYFMLMSYPTEQVCKIINPNYSTH